MAKSGRGVGPQSAASKGSGLHVVFPLSNLRTIGCNTIATLRQRDKKKSVSDIFCCAHRHCRPSAPLVLWPRRAGTKHARLPQRARPRPTPAGAPTPQDPTRRRSSFLPRYASPRPQASSPPLRRITAFASLLRRLCSQSLVIRRCPPYFCPPRLAITRTLPSLVAPPSALLCSSSGLVTKHPKHPKRRTVLFRQYYTLPDSVARHRVRPQLTAGSRCFLTWGC